MRVTAPLLFASTVSLLAGAVMLSASGCGRPSAQETAARGREVYQQCSACHGATATGDQALGAPSLAGLDAWYVAGQLRKFKAGIRGAHPRDVEGARMLPFAKALRDADIIAVATAVSQMPPDLEPSRVEGDAERGRHTWATCTSCHGPDGAGSPRVGAAPLNLGSGWYQVRQLEKFKAGIRGVHPDDTGGLSMRSVARTLPDEQAMRDVVAFVGTLR